MEEEIDCRFGIPTGYTYLSTPYICITAKQNNIAYKKAFWGFDRRHPIVKGILVASNEYSQLMALHASRVEASNAEKARIQQGKAQILKEKVARIDTVLSKQVVLKFPQAREKVELFLQPLTCKELWNYILHFQPEIKKKLGMKKAQVLDIFFEKILRPQLEKICLQLQQWSDKYEVPLATIVSNLPTAVAEDRLVENLLGELTTFRCFDFHAMLPKTFALFDLVKDCYTSQSLETTKAMLQAQMANIELRWALEKQRWNRLNTRLPQIFGDPGEFIQ
eukprot:Awhi_evm1s12767